MGIITSIVIAAVSVATAVISAKQQNEAIDKQAAIAKQREELAQRQAQMQLARDKAQLAKQARARRAAMANAQAAQGALFSSSAIGAQAAVSANLQSALDFADATGVISAQDSQLKGQQIDAQADADKTDPFMAGLKAATKVAGSTTGQTIGNWAADYFSSSSPDLGDANSGTGIYDGTIAGG